MTRLLRFAFRAAAAFALIMAVLPNPPHLPGGPSDKVGTCLPFAVLAASAAPGIAIGVLRAAGGSDTAVADIECGP